MLNVDDNKKLIEITRGDTAYIVFSALDVYGNVWNPISSDDTIKFAVSKKWGRDPLMTIVNKYNPFEIDAYNQFWTIVIETDDWLAKDENGDVIRDENGNGTDLFKFKDYVFDVQVTTVTGTETIIGQTSEITPTFRVLGEVATE